MRYLLGICLLAGLSGCSGPQAGFGVPAGSAAAPLKRASATYALLYSFKGHGTPDGGHPGTAVTQEHGTLYGTTSGVHGAPYGTIFALTGSGTETVLFHFKGHAKQGAKPTDLIDGDGTLFGCTAAGGSNGFGTVFSITPSGKLTTLHNFTGGKGDGAHPQGLLNVNGTLYGTTSSGGTHGDGTVFMITPSGTETVFYNFAGGSKDGASPVAPPIDVRGTLYGTTANDGKYGRGTVFAISPSGTETVLYSFKGGTKDGAGPLSALFDGHGVFYGTTWSGGSSPHCGGGCGTVYAITPAGKETIVHSFKGGTEDGAYPHAGVVDARGTLYGTTNLGGAKSIGTVFAITGSGKESVLHSFVGGTADGDYPVATLLYANRTLYGTTFYGGSSGAGTVFALTP